MRNTFEGSVHEFQTFFGLFLIIQLTHTVCDLYYIPKYNKKSKMTANDRNRSC